MGWYDESLGAERDSYDTNMESDGRNEPEFTAEEVESLKKSQFNNGFMLGVEFGFKQGEKNHNLEHTIHEARKLIAPKTEKRGA